MIRADLKPLIDAVLDREGGIKDVGDGKGVTRFGQTPQWLKQYDLKPPTTPAEAAENYQTWLDLTQLAFLVPLSDLLADTVIDFAVHSGARTAIRALQRAAGTVADGVIGPKTRAAVTQVDAHFWLARMVLAERWEVMGAAITNHPERLAKNAKGWARRGAGFLRELA